MYVFIHMDIFFLLFVDFNVKEITLKMVQAQSQTKALICQILIQFDLSVYQQKYIKFQRLMVLYLLYNALQNIGPAN